MDFQHPPVHGMDIHRGEAPSAGPADLPPAQWGRVTLVGAGPGDAELLTLKAAKALAQASLVLYDNLVSQDVLQLVPEGAERIYVGKQSSNHSLPQEGIIDLMIRLARENITMVVVTHEMGFARQVADRIVFMADGQIIEEGKPEHFFAHPENERVRQFLGKIIR